MYIDCIVHTTYINFNCYELMESMRCLLSRLFKFPVFTSYIMCPASCKVYVERIGWNLSHDIILTDRNGNGGSVAIYIRNNIAFKRLYQFESPALEALWLSIQTVEGTVLLYSCYRPPDRSGFWTEFDTILENISHIFINICSS